MDVFQVFALTTYNFLTVARGKVTGNIATLQPASTGVFKLVDAMISGDGQENRTTSARQSIAATLKVRPSESFIEDVAGNMVGHGIRVAGRDYTIVGQSAADNFHTGIREHYRLSLERADYSDVIEATS